MTKQLEFDFEENQKIKKLGSGADIVGTLDDPYHEPFLGCTKDPKTCENFLICFCEEEPNRSWEFKYTDDLVGYDGEEGKDEKK